MSRKQLSIMSAVFGVMMTFTGLALAQKRTLAACHPVSLQPRLARFGPQSSFCRSNLGWAASNVRHRVETALSSLVRTAVRNRALPLPGRHSVMLWRPCSQLVGSVVVKEPTRRRDGPCGL